MATPNADLNESGGVVRQEPHLGEQDPLEMRAIDIEQKLKAAYRQMVFLNQQIRDLQILYQRAEQNNRYASLDYITMRLSIVRGIKAMCHHYMEVKVAELERVVEQMFEEAEAESTPNEYQESDRVND